MYTGAILLLIGGVMLLIGIVNVTGGLPFFPEIQKGSSAYRRSVKLIVLGLFIVVLSVIYQWVVGNLL